MSSITFILFCAISVIFGVYCLINGTNGDGLNDDTVEVIKALVNRVQVLEAIVQSHPGELETLRRELVGKMEEQQLAHKTEMDKLRDDSQSRFTKIQTETRDKLYSMQKKYYDDLSELRNLCCPQFGLSGVSERINGTAKQPKDGQTAKPLSNTVNYVERNDIDSKRTEAKVYGILRHKRISAGGVIAFFATLSRTIDHLGTNQDIVFDRVITNVGNAYDANHGIFRAPVSGVYVFSTTVIVHDRDKGSFGFVHNTEKLTTIGLNGEENWGDRSSNTVVIYLNQGDDISVQSYSLDKGVYGANHNMISGFLLAADDDEASFVGK